MSIRKVGMIGVLGFTLGMIVNFAMWWAGVSLVASTIKSFGDCGKPYQVEKYKVQTNWFCPTEDYVISQMMPKENRRRR